MKEFFCYNNFFSVADNFLHLVFGVFRPWVSFGAFVLKASAAFTQLYMGSFLLSFLVLKCWMLNKGFTMRGKSRFNCLPARNAKAEIGALCISDR